MTLTNVFDHNRQHLSRMVKRSPTPYNQWGIYAMATKGNNGSKYDILDLGYPEHPNCNHWTAIAMGQNNTPADRTIGLARVGKDLTKDLTHRDVEFIDTSE